MLDDLRFKIALTLIPNIGDILAKRLVSYTGSAEAVFKEKKIALEKIPGIGSMYAQSILNASQNAFSRADEEITFIKKNNITPLFYLDKSYPKRLTYCEDSPVMLYYRGTTDLNSEKIISIIGTREPTEYGKKVCEQLVKELTAYNVIIVSGLAYGIDICAHKAALENKLDTIGVMAHGHDKLYPSAHKSVAKKMLDTGGCLTDFMSNTNPDKENFPKRNRIVAGIADATIIIESRKSGGSLITADIANSYNRDVFAFPGRVDDPTSEGCNNLIKQNKAALIQSANDIAYLLGWQKSVIPNKVQQQLFVELSEDEELLFKLLKEKSQANIDDLCYSSKMPMSKVLTVLLSLEFSGLIKSLPGKIYKLN